MLIIISRSRYNQCTKKEIIAICTITIWRSRISSCLSPSRYPTKLYILRHWRQCSPIGKMLKSECAVMGTDHSRSILSDYGGDTRTPVSLGDAMADIIMPFPILNTLRHTCRQSLHFINTTSKRSPYYGSDYIIQIV